jgi:hypothetical protein
MLNENLMSPISFVIINSTQNNNIIEAFSNAKIFFRFSFIRWMKLASNADLSGRPKELKTNKRYSRIGAIT